MSRFQHSFPSFCGSSLRSIPCAPVSFTWTPEDPSSSLLFPSSCISSFGYPLMVPHVLHSLLNRQGSWSKSSLFCLPELVSSAQLTNHFSFVSPTDPHLHTLCRCLGLQRSHHGWTQTGLSPDCSLCTPPPWIFTQGQCLIGQDIHFNASVFLPCIKPIPVLRWKCPKGRDWVYRSLCSTVILYIITCNWVLCK